MFNPSRDRQDYSELLTPPLGFETIFAIGTTYSLDLDALVGITLALGLSESIDSSLKDNPIYLLEALKRTADKVLIYCEKGQIKVPSAHSTLHILLEQMVVEVGLRNKKSFHPKIWLVKYGDTKGSAIYRLLVMSRNLTFDRSWDITVAMDGALQSEEVLQTRPLYDFLHSLTRNAKKDELTGKKKRVYNQLIREVAKVKFQMNDKRFNDFELIPLGIKNYKVDQTNIFNNFHELLIISPFLTGSIIKKLNDSMLVHDCKQTLITRRSELVKLKENDVTEIELFCMKEMIIDGEEAISESKDGQDMQGQELVSRQDIHAKLYLKTKYSNSELYIGSANASYNAFYGNVEFLICLKGKRRYLNTNDLKKDLFGDDELESPFELVTLPVGEVDAETEGIDLEKRLKGVLDLKISGYVSRDLDRYRIQVNIQEIEKINLDVNIYITPMLSNQRAALKNEMEFVNLEILQLSEFFIIEIETEEENIRRLMKIRLLDMPKDREGTLIKSIIKNRNGFIQYLSFLLEDDYLLGSLNNKENSKNALVFTAGVEIADLYEKLLKATVHSPEKFKNIERLMEMVTDQGIIPRGFDLVYNTFKEVVGDL